MPDAEAENAFITVRIYDSESIVGAAVIRICHIDNEYQTRLLFSYFFPPVDGKPQGITDESINDLIDKAVELQDGTTPEPSPQATEEPAPSPTTTPTSEPPVFTDVDMPDGVPAKLQHVSTLGVEVAHFEANTAHNNDDIVIAELIFSENIFYNEADYRVASCDFDNDGIVEALYLYAVDKGNLEYFLLIYEGDELYDVVPLHCEGVGNRMYIIDNDINDGKYEFLLSYYEPNYERNGLLVFDENDGMLIMQSLDIAGTTYNYYMNALSGYEFNGISGNRFMIGDVINMIGCRVFYADYELSDTYELVRVSDYNRTNGNPSIPDYDFDFNELKKDIKVKRYDTATGEPGKNTVIRAGTMLSPIATDNRTYVIMVDKQGNTYYKAITVEYVPDDEVAHYPYEGPLEYSDSYFSTWVYFDGNEQHEWFIALLGKEHYYV